MKSAPPTYPDGQAGQANTLIKYNNRLPVESEPKKGGLFGSRKKKVSSGLVSRDQVKELLFQSISSMPDQEAKMLRGIFALSNTTVRELMVPLSELMAVHISTPTDQVKSMVKNSNYQHLPVYEQRIDRLTGIVSLTDILYAHSEESELTSFIRPAHYVPETKLASDLLEDLRTAEDPVAIIIDEHGGCVGFISFFDIIELIVGTISHTQRRHNLQIEALGNGTWVIDARAPIDIVNEQLGIQVPKDRCDTIGGFILKLLGELPAQGVKINFDGIEFEVEEVFSYGITVLHAKKSNPPAIRK
ncbi:hypothetical protein CMK20_15795 [Candidatus Poribacteria bacterium]|nr:hypothetical protein [Candidatus Poribacteria bacterium]MCH2575472.1 CBS domain-containing protein [Candidatus Poribacteria bacterium]